MRITNKIIQNNSLTNINTNKTLQDSLSTMISTEKKISRPSDDPIVALRSLRLRTSVNQTSQYVDKNVEDAKSWLSVTEDAIDTLTDIITDVRKQYTKATSDTLTASDRRIITENLEALAAEIYNTGNADFAGRYVFTGYRTGTTLTFQKQEDIKYEITETETSADISTISYIHTGDTENDVYTKDIKRIRLSYENLTDDVPTLTLDGTAITCEVKSVDSDPYEYVSTPGNENKAVYVPETGEILLGENLSVEKLSVTYTKEEWNKGDLRPEHYFNCKDTTNNIEYKLETDPLTGEEKAGGIIEYNIGVNQSLRINTTADECFSHDIVRDIQDVVRALSEVDAIEETITNLKAEIEGYSDSQVAQKAAAEEKLEAAKKAQTYINEKLHSALSNCITQADKYLDANNVALTNCGTRSKRLELIENRLDTQLTTLKELKSENEDADLAETAVRLSSASYSYDAALMATGKILKETLLNYI